MTWKLFLEKLLRDFRISGNELAVLTGVHYPTINRIIRGVTLSPYPSTIKKIEEALKIRINDSDPNNITYRKLEEKSDIPFDGAISAQAYPLLATVYAGEPELLEHENHDETAYFAYNKPGHRCFSLRVSGRSMETTLRDGDTVLVDMDVPVVDGCLVAVRLKNGAQYIKRYHDLNYAFVKLTSDNSEYGVRLIDKNDIVSCYRVVSLNFAL